MSNDVIKLRNKKTSKVLRVGEDVYIRSLDSGVIEVREDFGCGNKIEYFKTFAKMFERYEEIKEPLIKNERIRKFVRDWAIFNQINTAHVERVNSEITWFLFVGKDSKYCRWEMAIHADFFETFGENYENIERPINDFCGEEE